MFCIFVVQNDLNAVKYYDCKMVSQIEIVRCVFIDNKRCTGYIQRWSGVA